MVSPVNVSYSVASGQPIYGGIVPVPAWRSAIAPNTWAEVGNALVSVDPKLDDTINPNHPLNSPWNGTVGQNGLVIAYSGACFDEAGQVLWLPLQGGHADYAGNEPYKIDLSVDSPVWEMVRNPSGALGNEGVLTNSTAAENTGLYDDGRPRAIHSYNKCVYIPGVGPAISTQGNCSFTASGGTDKPILISPITGEMTLHGADNPYSSAPSGSGACYDPTRHCIWYKGWNTGFIAKYDIALNSWSSIGSSHSVGGYLSLTYLPDQDCLLWISDGLTNGFAVVDCVTGTLYEPSISGSLVGMILSGRTQPRLFDTNTLALWDNTSDTTIINTLSFASNPRTDTWQIGQLPVDGSNAVTPTVKAGNGTYGRFFYIPKYDCFGVFNSNTDKIFMYARS